jgi:multidrug efflux pump subunit AcrA (membrane-fusion protein)
MGGILTSIGKEGTQGSKGIEFPATITVPNPARDLRAGMTVNVNYTDDDGNTFSLTGTVSALSRKEVKAEVDGTVYPLGALRVLLCLRVKRLWLWKTTPS